MSCFSANKFPNTENGTKAHSFKNIAAEELEIKPLLPAYFDPALQPQDLLTGVNFASGGAGYDSLTNELAVHVLISFLILFVSCSFYLFF